MDIISSKIYMTTPSDMNACKTLIFSKNKLRFVSLCYVPIFHLKNRLHMNIKMYINLRSDTFLLLYEAIAFD